MEVRYARSFLIDLKNLESAAYQRIYNFVFFEFIDKGLLYYLPEMRQVDSDGIFYRLTMDNYLIGIEQRGEIVKFLRVIPMPDV
ncbi:cytotoxic translational repressor of toxin-antitoxin stability system [Chlorogloeopsis sp. ULAP01]|uniref:cytotoxic translational repressor of toxin-antitoxin stability system n=1 Tax=Chlorogloeopsis sp. ULAP01 TaxID=3056483 RepID=UPI0025AA4780|nr:cytotoxic translational repressor of toxin-antitoxin stability system [Chlorogloeopsis sp. ULAP01]MDM9379910.1 cytotoxic translational repressor of toxin-antitoxin stability system [Chlorogloeopsis sp. ULAP01]